MLRRRCVKTHSVSRQAVAVLFGRLNPVRSAFPNLLPHLQSEALAWEKALRAREFGGLLILTRLAVAPTQGVHEPANSASN